MKKQSGFTLLEIMVVVVIMGMLASIVSFNVMGSKADAEIRKSKIDIKNIQQFASFPFLCKNKHQRQKGVPRHNPLASFIQNKSLACNTHNFGKLRLRQMQHRSERNQIIGHILYSVTFAFFTKLFIHINLKEPL